MNKQNNIGGPHEAMTAAAVVSSISRVTDRMVVFDAILIAFENHHAHQSVHPQT